MTGKLTVTAFFKRFPDDDACLEHLMDVRFGLKHVCRKCEKDATFHRLTDRKAYECSRCRDHVYPQAGTIFQDSRTSLVSWFYVMYLFVATRHGVSGKEIERQIGCTYKTAYRMGMQVRKLMAKADIKGMLSGHIEMDETYIGGRMSNGRGVKDKTIVFGMKERDGTVRAKTIPNTKMPTIRKEVMENVERGSVISTDDFPSYDLLAKDGYKHGAVNHSRKQWSYFNERYDALHHTNSIEFFWRMFKQSVASTHIHVSEKHMNKYVNEFCFRSNFVDLKNQMFDLLVANA